MTRIKWTDELVIEKINELHNKGESLLASDVRRLDQKLYSSACKRFESWGKALKASGIDPDAHRSVKSWSKEKIIDELKIIYKNHGDLSSTFLNGNGYSSVYVTARKIFGNFNEALVLAGFTPEDIYRKKAKWSEAEIQQEIDAVYRKSGTLSEKYFRNNHSKLVSVCQTKYGGWYKTLKHFGFPTGEVKFKWEDGNVDEVISEIKRLEKEGCSLNIKSIPNSIALRAVRVFGSWDEALVASEIDPKSHRKYEKWSREIMVERIKNHAGSGYNLSYSSIYQIDSALASSYTMYFGSWDDLITEAGYTPYQYTSVSDKMSLGYKFQQILKEIFIAINLNFSYEKTHGNVRPDFTLNRTTWIDAKLSSWTAIVDGTLRKYCDKINTLIIVYLRGNEIEGYNNVTFIPVDDFFPALKEIKRYDLIKAVDTLKQEIANIEEGTG